MADDPDLMAQTAFEALWALAAFVRITNDPGWRNRTPRDDVEQADLDVLQAAGFLRRDGEEWTTGVALQSMFGDTPIDQIAFAVRSTWLRANAHATGAPTGWGDPNADLIRSQGRASGIVPALLDQVVFDHLDGLRAALDAGGLFLDVGVGAGGLAIAFVQRFPTTTVLGIDILERALALATQDVEAIGLADRIRLERHSVADIALDAQCALAWIPQPFIPPDALVAGVRRVWSALVPGGWLVMGIATNDSTTAATSLTQSVEALHATLVGGGLTSVDDARELLADAGFVRVRPFDTSIGTVVVGRRPTVP